MKRIACAGSVFVLFFCGCVDLDQIAAIGKLTDQARSTLPLIAADLAGSCERQNIYAAQSCTRMDDFRKLGKNLVVEQNVLLDYFEALSNLAVDHPLGFASSVDGIDTAFGDAGLSSEQRTLAAHAGSLAAAVSDVVVKVYRRHQIEKVLQRADPDVAALTAGLAKQITPAGQDIPRCEEGRLQQTTGSAAGVSYLQLLSNECVQLTTYYGIPVKKDPDTPAGILLRTQYLEVLEKLNEREDAAMAYRNLMVSLGDAHQKLTAATKDGHFDAKQIGKLLGPDVVQIRAAVAHLREDLR